MYGDDDRFPTDPDEVIPIGKVIPWRGNGRRAVTTGLQPAYYGCYLYKMDVHLGSNQLKLYLQAMGEWNLPSPEQSLFCLVKRGETWNEIAQAERKGSKGDSRFVRARWVPTEESRGFFQGYLILALESLSRIAAQGSSTLQFRFGATYPWQTDYTVTDVLRFAQGEPISCPRTKEVVPPSDPWRPIFPKAVEERFRTRELSKEQQQRG